jgi:predicted transcriptional regulator
MSLTALEYLAGSSVRPEVLAVLREHGLLSLRDLADRVSASRRTVKRTLCGMESRGWVRPTGGAYELTALGGAMLSAHESFRERCRVASRLQPVLEHVPASMFDVDIEMLANAAVVGPEDDPVAFVDRMLALRSDAARIREYAPFLMLDTVRQLVGRVGTDDPTPDVTLVVRTAAPPQSSPAYRERLGTLADAPGVDMRCYPDGPMLGFGVADGRAFLGAATDDGVPCFLLESDAPQLVSWVERQFESCLAASEPLSH